MAISEGRSGGLVSNMAEKQVEADKLCISNLAGARAGCLDITVDKNPFIDETWIVKWSGSVVNCD